MKANDLFRQLSGQELAQLSAISAPLKLQKDAIVFSEGDIGDAAYIIESGNVAITIDKSGKSEQIAVLGPGDFFGEMAIFDNATRSASARTVNESVLWRVSKQDFVALTAQAPAFAATLSGALQARKIELFLREQLVSLTGVSPHALHVSIKGDPSLRETAFSRERYQSIADQVFPRLAPTLHKLLFDTVVYRVFVGLNNGEMRVASVLSPFVEEIHSAKKLVAGAYVERHFPPMGFEMKIKFMHELVACVRDLSAFAALSDEWRDVVSDLHADWKPVPREKLEPVLAHLSDLRRIPNFYLRSLNITVSQDAVQMQFNCDGTHIVSTNEYQKFLRDNIEVTA